MHDGQSYLNEIITGLISSLVGGFSAWFYTRRRQAKEVETMQVDLVERAAKMWVALGEELKRTVDAQGLQIKGLQDDNSKLFDEVKTLRKDNGTLSYKVKKFIEKYGE